MKYVLNEELVAWLSLFPDEQKFIVVQNTEHRPLKPTNKYFPLDRNTCLEVVDGI